MLYYHKSSLYSITYLGFILNGRSILVKKHEV